MGTDAKEVHIFQTLNSFLSQRAGVSTIAPKGTCGLISQRVPRETKECNLAPTVNNRCPVRMVCQNLLTNTCARFLLGPLTLPVFPQNTFHTLARTHPERERLQPFYQQNHLEKISFRGIFGNALIFRNWSPAGYQLLIWTKSIIFFLSSETVFSPKNNDETISLIRIFLHARNFLYLLSILPNSSFTGIVLLPSVTTSLSPHEPVSMHFAGFFEQNIVTSSPGLSFLVWHRGRRPETTVPRPFCQCGFFLDPTRRSTPERFRRWKEAEATMATEAGSWTAASRIFPANRAFKFEQYVSIPSESASHSHESGGNARLWGWNW